MQPADFSVLVQIPIAWENTTHHIKVGVSHDHPTAAANGLPVHVRSAITLWLEKAAAELFPVRQYCNPSKNVLGSYTACSIYNRSAV